MIRVALLLLLLPWVLSAQSRTSAVSGEVIDPAGAPAAGALVTVTDTLRGTSRSTRTAIDGRYRIPLLEPGSYVIEVSLEGFATDVRKDLRLSLDAEMRLSHRLALAGSTTTVDITAEAVAVGSTASAVEGLINRERIQQLPLLGRDYLQLSILQPGVHVARAYASNNNGGFGQPFSIGGSRPTQNSFRLDGAHLTNQAGATPGSLLGVNLGVEAIEEFSLTASTPGASAGRGSGGMVHAVTRAGTNDFHGSLFYYHRNSAVDARNFFDQSTTAAFRRHQFGGSLGGPIRSGKTFFFANIESIRDFQERSTLNTTISDAARQGRLTSGNVPVHPAIQPFLALLPAPNGEIFGDTGLFLYRNPIHARETFVTSRLDHHWSDRDRSFLRTTFDNAAREDLTNFALAQRNNRTRMGSASAEHTHVYTPALYQSTRFGWLRSHMNVGDSRAASQSLDNPALAFVPSAPGPGIVYNAALSTFEAATGGLDRDRSTFDSYQSYTDVSWMRGRHLVRFGGSAEFTHFDLESTTHPLGEFTFESLPAFLANRPLRFRALMPGTDAVRAYRQEVFSWYVQDTIRLSRRLTLELGLRHEWMTVPRETSGRIAVLEQLTDTSMRTTGSLFSNPSFGNLTPRAGLSWDLAGGGKSVLRAGFGSYPDLILSHFLLIAGVRNPPFFLAADVQNPAAGSFPGGAYRDLAAQGVPDYRVDSLDPRPAQPMVRQWNASWQQMLPRNWSLQATYAGSAGRNLSTLVEDANLFPYVKQTDGRIFFPPGGVKPNPVFGFIRNRLFDGRSSYHALQSLLRRQWRGGSLMQASYTWGKSIDDDSTTFARTDSSNSIGIPIGGIPGFNRGLSNHDVRHHLTLHSIWAIPTRARFRNFGAWQVGSLISAGSGLPFSATLGYDAARSGTSRPDYRGGQRPDANPSFRGSATTGNPSRWFNPEAFLRPAAGYMGNLGRNTLIGPNWFSADAMINGDFRVPKAEGFRLSVRIEVFNLTNHTNFDLPGGRRSQVFSRTGIPEDVGRITSAGPARKWQGGLRLGF